VKHPKSTPSARLSFGSHSDPSFEVLCRNFFQDRVDTLFGRDIFFALIDRQPDCVSLSFHPENLDPKSSITLYAFFEMLAQEDETLSSIRMDVYIRRKTGVVVVSAPDSVAMSLFAQRFNDHYNEKPDSKTKTLLKSLKNKALDEMCSGFTTYLIGRDFTVIPPSHVMRAFAHHKK